MQCLSRGRTAFHRRILLWSMGGGGTPPSREVEAIVFIGDSDEAFDVALRKVWFDLFSGGEVVAFEDEFGGSDIGSDVWPAERPAGAGGHVHAETEAFGLADGVGEHVHPLGREEINEAIFVAFGAVNGTDLDAAEAGGVIFGEQTSEVGFVHGAAEPPPAGPGTVFEGGRGPREIGMGSGVGRGNGR